MIVSYNVTVFTLFKLTVRYLTAAVMLVSLVLVSGCRTQLFTHLDEVDANAIVSALQSQRLDAVKTTEDGGKTWSIQVSDDQVQMALRLLQEQGLPRQKHASLGDLFGKESLVSSPEEERVRLLHGMAQELSETISHIDGVVTARVHIVLPERDRWNRPRPPSSASVFIKHQAQIRIDVLQPAIRSLVASAVEGLEPDRVSVTMVATQARPSAFPPGVFDTRWLLILLAVGVLMMAGAGLIAWRWWRTRDRQATSTLAWPDLSDQLRPGADVA